VKLVAALSSKSPWFDPRSVHVGFIVDNVTMVFFWWGNLRERDHLGDPIVDRRITLTL